MCCPDCEIWVLTIILNKFIIRLDPLTQRAFCVKGDEKSDDFFAVLRESAAFFIGVEKTMETRVAVMSIIVEDAAAVEQINALLHEYGDYIIGRMGLPYRKRNINIISIAIDAPQNEISSLAGKIGKLPSVSVKTAYSAVIADE